MNNKICKFYEEATIFDLDFNDIEYKYCNLFDDECKKAIKTKYCPYRLNKKLNSYKEKLNYYKQALEEIREIAKICLCRNIDGCCIECKFYDECKIEEAEIPTRDVCALIIKKISEVLK